MTPAISFAQAPPAEIRISGLTVAEANTLRAEVNRLAADRRVSARALSAIAERLGASQTSPDIGNLLRLIDERATELQALQDRLSVLARSDDPTITDRISRARVAIDAGDLATADRLLGEAAQSDLAAIAIAEAQTNARRTRAAETIAERGRLAALQSAYNDSATLYAQAADTAPTSDVAARWRYRMGQANALRSYAEESGSTDAAHQAIGAYTNLALPLAPRDARPRDWAKTWSELGVAHGILGTRGDETELQEAVASFQQALSVFTPQTDSVDWAAAQASLGLAMSGLAERDPNANLSGAISAFQAALSVLSPRSDPWDWARANVGLGIALDTQGERGGNEPLLRAEDALSAALTVFTRERYPRDWAGAQVNLANVRGKLGARGNRVALARAIEGYQQALTYYTRERTPMNWALTKVALAYTLLETQGQGLEVRRRAVSALDDALTVLSIDNNPMYWASAHNLLGVASEADGDAGDRSAYADALEHFQLALGAYQRANLVVQASEVQENIRRVSAKTGGAPK
jgi:hypothetical protein